jgi:hypothetical protein
MAMTRLSLVFVSVDRAAVSASGTSAAQIIPVLRANGKYPFRKTRGLAAFCGPWSPCDAVPDPAYDVDLVGIVDCERWRRRHSSEAFVFSLIAPAAR